MIGIESLLNLSDTMHEGGVRELRPACTEAGKLVRFDLTVPGLDSGVQGRRANVHQVASDDGVTSGDVGRSKLPPVHEGLNGVDDVRVRRCERASEELIVEAREGVGSRRVGGKIVTGFRRREDKNRASAQRVDVRSGSRMGS